ncbi:MAG: sigma-70 family RNA polymerase sigma factor [Acidobacteriota bacterium]
MRIDPISELGGLRALARSLVHGDADADDLLQDAAVAALEHPPELDRPVRPWLATVILNRWRMNRRGAARRQARELALDAPEAVEVNGAERAETLRRLGNAVASLAEPYRATVIARYFDGKSAAEIAREAGIPAVTVRTRLSRALEQLRSALDEQAPRKRWQRALVPGGLLVKTKASSSLIGLWLLLVLVAGGTWWLWPRAAHAPRQPVASAPLALPHVAITPAVAAAPAAHGEPTSGQKRASVEVVALPGGSAGGRVINWSTGDGVAGAELTFTSDGGATSVKTDGDGAFELTAASPGAYSLTSVGAPGFLPYAPEYLHSSVHFELTREHAVKGLTVFLFPALDYHGLVVDEAGKPVAGAKISLLGTPAGEQAIDRLEAAWTSDADGRFTFHAADEAVLEATAGDRRGWAVLDGDVAITKQMKIAIARVPARDATITGRVVEHDRNAVDHAGTPLPDVLVRAEPVSPPNERGGRERTRSTSFAVSSADGTFELRGLDRGAYKLMAEAEDHAPAIRSGVSGGTHDVTLELSAGVQLAGKVVTSGGAPVPAFTLLVYRREGVARELVVARSVVDAGGRFDVRVAADAYELIASASGWAPSAPTQVTAPARDVSLTVTAGATLVGTVVSAADGHPLAHARVMREAPGGGASAQPANAGTVTRADGTFELSGIPPGPVSITIGAGDYDQKIESGMTAVDGGQLGPLTIALTPIAPGAAPKIDLVGIGVKMTSDGPDLLVQDVIPGGGAQAAGIVAGDRIVSVDGQSAVDLGMEGAISRIRGAEGTKVAIGLRRKDKIVTVLVTRTKIQA